MRSRWLFVIVTGVSLTLLTTTAVPADDGVTISTPIPGSLEQSPAGVVQERITLPPGLAERLAAVPEGAPVVIGAWPVEPGTRRTVTVRRHRVVSPEARRLLITLDGATPLASSSRVHLWGDIDDGNGRVLVALDRDGGALRGFMVANGAVHEILPDGDDHVVVATADRLEAEGWPIAPWTCSLDERDASGPALVADGFVAMAKSGESSGHTATIAFDTDTELMQLKFSNNQTAALDYIADLVAAMNVMYERDLDVTLLQGDTFLRVGSDPYQQDHDCSPESSADLAEFSSYWSAHYSSVDRALAAMLSGKSPAPNQACGIAWVSGLCSHSYGYSFTKVFRIDYLAGDAFVVGHELGHNFGSRHTHCYSPPIDQCYSGESGCYVGSTSCPGGPGTVMSYCHVAGCGSNRMEFHSRVIANILTNHVSPAIGVCIFSSGGGEPLFDDGFESGDTDAWSTTGP